MFSSSSFKSRKQIPFLFSFSISIIMLQLTLSAFGNVVPGDVEYWKHEAENQTLLYAPEHADLVPKVLQMSELLHEHFQRSYQWTLDERNFLILGSNRNQIPNATATVIPYSTNTFYGGGAEMVDSFAIRSWLTTLVIHELAHLYQMNPNQGLGRLTKRIFGNHIFLFYPLVPIPIFVQPNILLPSWIVEGNAVLNESLFGNGGRLFSGEGRALFMALVKAGKLDKERLINDHLSFPFGHEKYIVGGYFNLFLARKFGIDKTNQLFLKHSAHFINPLLLNQTFLNHFGEDYDSNVEDFLRYFSRKAQSQQSSSGPLLTTSTEKLPLNGDERRLYFLTNKDGRSEYRLNILDRQSLQWEERPIDLPPGKVFVMEKMEKDEFASAGYGQLNSREVVFGLWGEGKKFYPEFRSRLLLDKKGRSLLYLDMTRSFDQPFLMQDQRPIGHVNSTAILDQQGRAYYFKQSGKERTLFQDQRPLFTLSGYYAKLVGLDREGNVDFIAATPSGSSLYQYRSQTGKFHRLTSSDVVVEARQIRDRLYLLVEATPEHYAYRVVSLSPTPKEEDPKHYRYFFEDSKIFASPSLTTALANPAVQPSPYNSLASLKFQAWEIQTHFGSEGQTTVQGNFVDPLGQNSLLLRGQFSHEKEEKLGRAVYTNSRFPLAWSLDATGVLEKERPFTPLSSRSSLGLGLSYPIAEWGRWKSQGRGKLFYEDGPWKTYASLELGKSRQFSQSFLPFEHLSFLAEGSAEREGEKTALSWKYLHDMGRENFLEHETILHYSTTGSLLAGRPVEDDIPTLLPTRKTSLFSRKDINIKGGRLGLGYRKVFNNSVYFSTFPLSLRRWATRLFANDFLYELPRKRRYQEMGLGLQFEFLLTHLYPFRVSVEAIKPFPNGDSVVQINLLTL